MFSLHQIILHLFALACLCRGNLAGVYPDIRALALDSRNRGGMMTRRKWYPLRRNLGTNLDINQCGVGEEYLYANIDLILYTAE